jgi:hypothetical protein
VKVSQFDSRQVTVNQTPRHREVRIPQREHRTLGAELGGAATHNLSPGKSRSGGYSGR